MARVSQVDAEVLEIAEQVCTARQLEAMKLRAAGLSWREIAAVMTGQPAVATVRDLVMRGLANVERAQAAG